MAAIEAADISQESTVFSVVKALNKILTEVRKKSLKSAEVFEKNRTKCN